MSEKPVLRFDFTPAGRATNADGYYVYAQDYIDLQRKCERLLERLDIRRGYDGCESDEIDRLTCALTVAQDDNERLRGLLEKCREIMECNDVLNAREIFGNSAETLGGAQSTSLTEPEGERRTVACSCYGKCKKARGATLPDGVYCIGEVQP